MRTPKRRNQYRYTASLWARRKQPLNSLELAGKKILDSLSVHYIEQYIIDGRYCVDVYIPDFNLIIQWDGDYYHGNPSRYSKLNTMQKKNQYRDRRCDTYLQKAGYRILRFWEQDVHKQPALVKAKIRNALDSLH